MDLDVIYCDGNGGVLANTDQLADYTEHINAKLRIEIEFKNSEINSDIQKALGRVLGEELFLSAATNICRNERLSEVTSIQGSPDDYTILGPCNVKNAESGSCISYGGMITSFFSIATSDSLSLELKDSISKTIESKANSDDPLIKVGNYAGTLNQTVTFVAYDVEFVEDEENNYGFLWWIFAACSVLLLLVLYLIYSAQSRATPRGEEKSDGTMEEEDSICVENLSDDPDDILDQIQDVHRCSSSFCPVCRDLRIKKTNAESSTQTDEQCQTSPTSTTFIRVESNYKIQNYTESNSFDDEESEYRKGRDFV